MRQATTPSLGLGTGDQSLTDALYRNALDHPDDPLLCSRSSAGWVDMVASEVASRARRLAAGLVANGVQAGDRVAIMSHSRAEWTLCDYAIWTAGAVTVPVYETSSVEQVGWVLADSGAVAVFCETAAHLVTVAAALAEADHQVEHQWSFAGDDLSHLEAEGQAVPATEVEARRLTLDRSSLATLIYTSGTTGRPKGCELTHGNCLAALAEMTPKLGELFGPEGSTLLFLPLAHIFARSIQIACVSTRARLAYCPSPAHLAEDLQSFRPTFILSVPRVFEKIYDGVQQQAAASGRLAAAIFGWAVHTAVAWSTALDNPRGPGVGLAARHRLFDRLVYRRLRHATGGRIRWSVSGGGPLGPRLGHFFRGAGLNVLEVYGLTETIGSTFNFPGEQKIGTVGRPVPGTTIRLDDDGEVLVQSGSVFAGYWHAPAATSEALADGWLRTGDLGALDDEGYLSIIGRKKELIVTSGGKNVAPAPLEDLVRANPLVSQCLVVGDRRAFVAALVTLDPDAVAGWARARQKPTEPADLVQDADLLAAIQLSVDHANQSVSRAESIRAFRVLPDDFSEASGEVTPTLKLRRNVIATTRAEEIEALYRG